MIPLPKISFIGANIYYIYICIANIYHSEIYVYISEYSDISIISLLFIIYCIYFSECAWQQSKEIFPSRPTRRLIGELETVSIFILSTAFSLKCKLRTSIEMDENHFNVKRLPLLYRITFHWMRYRITFLFKKRWKNFFCLFFSCYRITSHRIRWMKEHFLYVSLLLFLAVTRLEISSSSLSVHYYRDFQEGFQGVP